MLPASPRSLLPHWARRKEEVSLPLASFQWEHRNDDVPDLDLVEVSLWNLHGVKGHLEVGGDLASITSVENSRAIGTP